jgi:hypothetical protein
VPTAFALAAAQTAHTAGSAQERPGPVVKPKPTRDREALALWALRGGLIVAVGFGSQGAVRPSVPGSQGPSSPIAAPAATSRSRNTAAAVF